MNWSLLMSYVTLLTLYVGLCDIYFCIFVEINAIFFLTVKNSLPCNRNEVVPECG